MSNVLQSSDTLAYTAQHYINNIVNRIPNTLVVKN